MSTKAKVITAVVSILVICTIAYFMYQAGKKAGKKALEADAAKALEASQKAIKEKNDAENEIRNMEFEMKSA